LPDLSRMYSIGLQSALELHIAHSSGPATDRLSRTEARCIQSGMIFALSPPDILVQQALHLLKHLSGEHTRISWVLEFWRHAKSRRFDAVFWSDVERIAADEVNGNLALAIAFFLADAFFGSEGVEVPMRWWSEHLPDRVRLWLELYGVDVLLSDSIGSKLYALLKQEIPGASEDGRSIRQVLLPTKLPLRQWGPAAHEQALGRWKRYLVELNYFAHRCCFHFIEGIRFAIESARWKRAVARCGR
jgi:hypothetical protein